MVETDLTLLTHASLPLIYWPFALATAVYLINRMPTPTLNLNSPFQKIFHTTPNYSKLKIFGCLCYPWLRPYTFHKLESRSKPCIFVGYSLTQSAYLCLDPASSRIYVSRHVKFVESQFPYSSLSTKPMCQPTSPVSTWIPPPIHVVSSTPQLVTQAPADVDSSQQLTCATTISSTSPVVSSSPSPSAARSHTAQPVPSSSQPNPSPGASTSQTHGLAPTHPMITRAKNNIHRPLQKMNLHTQLTPSREIEPTSVSKALSDPH